MRRRHFGREEGVVTASSDTQTFFRRDAFPGVGGGRGAVGFEERLEKSFDHRKTPEKLKLGLDKRHRLVKTGISPLGEVAAGDAKRTYAA